MKNSSNRGSQLPFMLRAAAVLVMVTTVGCFGPPAREGLFFNEAIPRSMDVDFGLCFVPGRDAVLLNIAEGGSHRLSLYDFGMGELETLTEGVRRDQFFSIADDGRRVVFSSAFEDDTEGVFLLDLEDRTIERLTESGQRLSAPVLMPDSDAVVYIQLDDTLEDMPMWTIMKRSLSTGTETALFASDTAIGFMEPIGANKIAFLQASEWFVSHVAAPEWSDWRLYLIVVEAGTEPIRLDSQAYIRIQYISYSDGADMLIIDVSPMPATSLGGLFSFDLANPAGLEEVIPQQVALQERDPYGRPVYNATLPTWLLSGAEFVCSVSPDFPRRPASIYRVDAETYDFTKIFESEFEIVGLAASADGSTIALIVLEESPPYHSHLDGMYVLNILDIDGNVIARKDLYTIRDAVGPNRGQ